MKYIFKFIAMMEAKCGFAEVVAHLTVNLNAVNHNPSQQLLFIIEVTFAALR